VHNGSNTSIKTAGEMVLATPEPRTQISQGSLPGSFSAELRVSADHDHQSDQRDLENKIASILGPS
jgi:hypothetical protein